MNWIDADKKKPAKDDWVIIQKITGATWDGKHWIDAYCGILDSNAKGA